METLLKLLPLLIPLSIFLALDLYSYQAVHALTRRTRSRHVRRGLRWAYWGISGGFWLYAAGAFVFLALYERAAAPTHVINYLAAGMLIFFVPKLIITAFMLLEDITRGLRWLGLGLGRLVAARRLQGANSRGASPTLQQPAEPGAGGQPGLSRSEFLSKAALGLATVPFLTLSGGIALGRDNFQLHQRTLWYPNLPPAFDGLRIVQISDVHAGSFFSTENVAAGLQVAIDQQPDLLLFSGDMVNNLASEFEPYVAMMRRIQPRLGGFSVLGNHDYGDYVFGEEPSPEKAANLRRLAELQAAAGLTMLRNGHAFVERAGQRLAIVGVENWGLPPFPRLGDLDQATAGLRDEEFKILLSHDPSHWDAKVRPHALRYDLTLSGHTHGMQFGIELGDFRWSPAQLKYPRWADLYTEGPERLYVNRGFGFLAFPGRVGIMPEITRLELRRGPAPTAEE